MLPEFKFTSLDRIHQWSDLNKIWNIFSPLSSLIRIEWSASIIPVDEWRQFQYSSMELQMIFFLCYLVGLGETLCWSKPTSLMHFMLILKVNIYHTVCCKVTSIELLVYCDTFVSCQLNPLPSFLVLFYLSEFCDSAVSWSLLQLWIFWDSNCSILNEFRPYLVSWDSGTNT